MSNEERSVVKCRARGRDMSGRGRGRWDHVEDGSMESGRGRCDWW